MGSVAHQAGRERAMGHERPFLPKFMATQTFSVRHAKAMVGIFLRFGCGDEEAHDQPEAY